MKLTRMDDLGDEPVSHNPAIRKRVLLRKGSVAHLTQFAEARFEPGQIAPGHTHPEMSEVFYVSAGAGTIRIGDAVHALTPGTCVTVEPGERHEVAAATDQPLVLLYFGIAN